MHNHEDLKASFTDLKTTLITGFRSLPTRESSDELIRLLRENNRIQDAVIQGRGDGAPTS